MREMYHHLQRGDLRIDHATLNSRTVGILAPHAGTDLEIRTQILPNVQVQMQPQCRQGYGGSDGAAPPLPHDEVSRGSV